MNSETFVATLSNPTIDFDINTLPGYYPDFKNGVWQQVSAHDSRTITKTIDNQSSGGSYQLPGNGSTGSVSDSTVTTLSDEYTTDMMIAAGDTAFDIRALEEEKKEWEYGFPPISISTYTKKDESMYGRAEFDYALEPQYSPDVPVRVAWLDVNRTDLGRGYQGGTPDNEATQTITLREKFYSTAKAVDFIKAPSQVKNPRAETRRLVADLNKQRLILPLSCTLEVNFSLGPLIATHDAGGQPLPIDWDDPDGEQLDINYIHNTWRNDFQYGNIVADEFDVPVKLEAVEGGG